MRYFDIVHDAFGFHQIEQFQAKIAPAESVRFHGGHRSHALTSSTSSSVESETASTIFGSFPSTMPSFGMNGLFLFPFPLVVLEPMELGESVEQQRDILTNEMKYYANPWR